MNIVGIDSITYGTDRLDDAIRFHQDWGLTLVTAGATGAEFELLDGTSLNLRHASDPGLPMAVIDWCPELNRATVREIVWGVDSKQSLDAIAAELERDRSVIAGSDGVLRTVDDSGNPIGFKVTARRPLHATPPVVNSIGFSPRLNRRGDGAVRRRVHPARYSHAVYWTPGDVGSKVRFYTERLGFRVTDRIIDGSAFLRAPLNSDHHSLFLQSRGSLAGFQHVAYEVASHDDVMLLGAYMESRGWRTNVGPLRHNVGASFSWYMWNPAGGVVEVLADIDRVDDRWEASTIDPTSPDFYGHTWIARPEHEGVRPADWPPR